MRTRLVDYIKMMGGRYAWRLATEKFRFEIGKQYLVYINFALLIVAASREIQNYIDVSTPVLVVLGVPAAFVGSWVLGVFLDRLFNFPGLEMEVKTRRNPHMKEISRQLKEIQKEMAELRKDVELIKVRR